MTTEDARTLAKTEYSLRLRSQEQLLGSTSTIESIEDIAMGIYAKDAITRALEKVTRMVTDEQSKTIDRVLSIPSNLPINRLVEGKITSRQFVDYLEKELKAAMRV
jgi:hypothetical protein